MRGTIPLKVGQFRFDNHSTLNVLTDDEGITLVFRDLLTNHVWAALIDERGTIINPIIKRCRQSGASMQALKRRLHGDDDLPRPRRRTHKPATRVWFIVQWEKNRNPKKVMVLGGFQSGKQLIVLYRTSGKSQLLEDQLLFEDGRVETMEVAPFSVRLPDDRWDEVLALRDGEEFELSGIWRKLPTTKLRELFQSKRFQLCFGPKPPNPA